MWSPFSSSSHSDSDSVCSSMFVPSSFRHQHASNSVVVVVVVVVVVTPGTVEKMKAEVTHNCRNDWRQQR